MKAHDWDELYRAHGPMVWATVCRVLNDHADALDCCQEVFLEAFRQARDRPVDDWPSLLKWLSVRRAIDGLRRRKREHALGRPGGDAMEVVPSRELSSESVELQELMACLTTELAALPARQAEAFWLRSVEQMSYAEIAVQMQTDTNAVGVLIHRARQTLCQSLSAFAPSPTPAQVQP